MKRLDPSWLFRNITHMVAIAVLLGLSPVFAQKKSSYVERALKVNDWGVAARQIFIEARILDPHASSIVAGQAAAGYIDDALTTIDGTHKGKRSWLLITLLREAPSIPSEKKKQLLQDAVESARTGTAGHYIRSGDLARIALYFSGQRSESDSRQMFTEALDAAKNGFSEEGSGGFRQITEMLRNASSSEVMPWMVESLVSALRTTQNPTGAANTVFACIDMVEVAERLERTDLAAFFIECATASIRYIKDSRMKEHARERLGLAKNEFGITEGAPYNIPLLKAIHEARKGNASVAYTIVSGLGQNLYVDHKGAVFKQVFDDAIRRKDVSTAIYFAERSVGTDAGIYVWLRLAEVQLEIGQKKAASESYQRALNDVEKVRAGLRIYLTDIKSILALGESLFRSGKKNEAHRCVDLAYSLLNRIPYGQTADRVRASIVVAEALLKIGSPLPAYDLLRVTYSEANADDDKQRYSHTEKANTLAYVAQSLSRLPVFKR